MRQVLAAELDDPALARRAGQIVMAGKNYYGTAFERDLATAGITLIRPARKGEPPRPGGPLLRPLGQATESVNATVKGQLDLEHRPARQAIPGRLRPLTPWNRSSGPGSCRPARVRVT
jgi:hypothetical protein